MASESPETAPRAHTDEVNLKLLPVCGCGGALKRKLWAGTQHWLRPHLRSQQADKPQARAELASACTLGEVALASVYESREQVRGRPQHLPCQVIVRCQAAETVSGMAAGTLRVGSREGAHWRLTASTADAGCAVQNESPGAHSCARMQTLTGVRRLHWRQQARLHTTPLVDEQAGAEEVSRIISITGCGLQGHLLLAPRMSCVRRCHSHPQLGGRLRLRLPKATEA